MPLEKRVSRMFLQHQGQNSSKTKLFTVFLSERVETAVFLAMFFRQRAENVSEISVFSSLL